MTDNRFAGKVALVTGAGNGIGETVAEQLLREGACVGLLGREYESVRSAAVRMDPGGRRSLALEADVRDSRRIKNAIETIIGRFGTLDLAVNNAGIPGPAGIPVPSLDEQTWRDVIDTDLTGTFLCMKFEIEAMLDKRKGAIVNMASANGLVGLAGMAAYTAAKHGIIGLTRCAALELAESGVRVCAVAPGYVATPRILESGAGVTDEMARVHPMKRLASREDVSSLVTFLLSDDAAFITGSVHCVDGGYTAA